MCQLIVSPDGIVPDWDSIESSYLANGDSWGAVYLDAHGLKKVCGLADDWQSLADLYATLQAAPTPFLWHFRWATHGRVDRANCHPFPIGKGLYFAHNGVLQIPTPDKAKSDTWHMAQHLKTQKLTTTDLVNPAIIKWLHDLAGRGNKFAFLDYTGETTIINEPAGDWIEKVWFSNPSCLYTVSWADWYKDETAKDETCDYCGLAISAWNGVSGISYTCSECWEQYTGPVGLR